MSLTDNTPALLRHADRFFIGGEWAEPSSDAKIDVIGPVLSAIPAKDERDATRVANGTIYGLNSSVFTNDVDRARDVARQLRAGTVGHNAFRTDFGVAFGGFKQSGIGREGGTEGLLPFLETKTVILEGRPARFRDSAQ
jgi:aldehyde dehydrogenase (NAD+)